MTTGSSSLLRLDEVMFAGSWFAIDAGNRRVPGVVVADLVGGLQMVGHGSVAALVGRLRDEIRVVDVDLDEVRGQGAVDAVTDWCDHEGLWSLVRPSGGGPGRAHVFIAHEGRLAALQALVENLRAQLSASARSLDVRATVRPLSSPHRTGRHTHPVRPAEALRSLTRHDWATLGATPAPGGPLGGPGTRQALLPRRRRDRAPLPAAWAAYLAHGTSPRVGGPDQSRSAVELVATAALLRAGHDADSAWEAITAAHPEAFVRARASHRRWVAWVWNAAVATDDAFQPAPSPAGGPAPAIAAAVAGARGRLRRLAWTVPARRRPALLLVGHTVLDRVARTDQMRVPVPERDLVLDTGLTDRKTIRAQLRLLAEGGVGTLHTDTFDPGRRASTSFEFELPTPQQGALSQIPPPSSHTPYAPPGLWGLLPSLAHQLWRALQDGDHPRDLDDLARDAQVTAGPDRELSLRQVRTVKAALVALAESGLVECTAEAQWVARAHVDPAHAQRAHTQRAGLEDAIALERAAYRAPSGASPWSVARAAALKANRIREEAWWAALSPVERGHRRTAWQARFAALSVHEQETRKAELADRRMRAGVDEPRRHDAWLDGLSWDDYAHRSAQRAAAFAALPSPMRQAKAAAWARHRQRYRISQGTRLSQSRREYATALPDSRAVRDDIFWSAQQALPHDGSGAVDEVS